MGIFLLGLWLGSLLYLISYRRQGPSPKAAWLGPFALHLLSLLVLCLLWNSLP